MMNTMRTLGLAVSSGALLTAAQVGIAGVLRVPSEYPTIQQAIDAAVSGDSVLVAPGTYTNCDERPCTTRVAEMKAGVALVSEAGPELTTLRVDVPAGGASVVRGSGIVFGETLLRGFTITATAPDYKGTAFVSCLGVRIEHCVFADLDPGSSIGGGLFTNGSTVEVQSCEFQRCTAVEGAGYGSTNGSSIVERCLFEECEGGHVAQRNRRDFGGGAELRVPEQHRECCARGAHDAAGGGFQ
jgi:hypothetical protein